LATVSHAKCNNCGANRHLHSRRNLCRVCWNERKPLVRAEWQAIKERRRARVAGQPEVTTFASDEERAARKEELKAQGVKPGQKEWGEYLLLSRSDVARPIPYEHILIRLYTETDIPVDVIARGLSIAKYEVERLRKKHHLLRRSELPKFRPPIRYTETEELAWDGDRLILRHPSGLIRDALPSEEHSEKHEEIVLPQEIPPIEHHPVIRKLELPPPQEHPARRTLTPEECTEIVRLYLDPAVPVPEIISAYRIADTRIYKVIKDAGVPARRHWVNGQPPGTASPAPVPVAPVPPTPLALDGHAVATERSWYVKWTVNMEGFISSPSVEELMRRLHETHGEGVDVVSITRA
jgi:hypothetical protein